MECPPPAERSSRSLRGSCAPRPRRESARWPRAQTIVKCKGLDVVPLKTCHSHVLSGKFLSHLWGCRSQKLRARAVRTVSYFSAGRGGGRRLPPLSGLPAPTPGGPHLTPRPCALTFRMARHQVPLSTFTERLLGAPHSSQSFMDADSGPLQPIPRAKRGHFPISLTSTRRQRAHVSCLSKVTGLVSGGAGIQTQMSTLKLRLLTT